MLYALEELLDGKIEVYQFENLRPLYWKKTDYLITAECDNERTGFVFALKADPKGNVCFIDSLFEKENQNYAVGQKKYTVLRKEKRRVLNN